MCLFSANCAYGKWVLKFNYYIIYIISAVPHFFAKQRLIFSSIPAIYLVKNHLNSWFSEASEQLSTYFSVMQMVFLPRLVPISNYLSYLNRRSESMARRPYFPGSTSTMSEAILLEKLCEFEREPKIAVSNATKRTKFRSKLSKICEKIAIRVAFFALFTSTVGLLVGEPTVKAEEFAAAGAAPCWRKWKPFVLKPKIFPILKYDGGYIKTKLRVFGVTTPAFQRGELSALGAGNRPGYSKIRPRRIQ